MLAANFHAVSTSALLVSILIRSSSAMMSIEKMRIPPSLSNSLLESHHSCRSGTTTQDYSKYSGFLSRRS